MLSAVQYACEINADAWHQTTWITSPATNHQLHCLQGSPAAVAAASTMPAPTLAHSTQQSCIRRTRSWRLPAPNCWPPEQRRSACRSSPFNLSHAAPGMPLTSAFSA